MATIDENLKAFLQADTSIAQRVAYRIHENHVPHKPKLPFIFFVQTDDDDELCLDDAAGSGPFRYFFAVECISDSLRESRELARLVKSRLNKLAPGATFGATTVQGCFCESQKDDYEQRVADTGFHVCALQCEVIP